MDETGSGQPGIVTLLERIRLAAIEYRETAGRLSA